MIMLLLNIFVKNLGQSVLCPALCRALPLGAITRAATVPEIWYLYKSLGAYWPYVYCPMFPVNPGEVMLKYSAENDHYQFLSQNFNQKIFDANLATSP